MQSVSSWIAIWTFTCPYWKRSKCVAEWSFSVILEEKSTRNEHRSFLQRQYNDSFTNWNTFDMESLKARHKVGKSCTNYFWQQKVSFSSRQPSLPGYKAKWSFLTNDFTCKHDVPPLIPTPSRYLGGFQTEIQGRCFKHETQARLL